MALDQLPQFMDAIAAQESGGKYDAVGPYTGSTYGRARGKYQIMETIWPGWAREAGIPGADWRDPQAQEHVARFKMGQYYKRYGSWDLVAVAWFAGPGTANKAAKNGIGSVGNLNDVLGTTVAKYVKTMKAGMGRASSGSGSGARDPLLSRYGGSQTGFTSDDPREQAAQQALSPDEEFVASRRLQGDSMAAIMQMISKAAMGQGGKVIDAGALFSGGQFEQEDDGVAVEEVPTDG